MDANIVVCKQCSFGISTAEQGIACLCSGKGIIFSNGIGQLETGEFPASAEAKVRDRQAHSYLQHGKFPTQIASFESWLKLASNRATREPARIAENTQGRLALDLGCGPGPYSKKLLDAGYRVIAIDFSAESLKLNATSCNPEPDDHRAVFVHADLNRLQLQPESFDVVVMADFLQHLGGRAQRERLLDQVFSALKPMGGFYLSFFNLNIKNYFKSDVHGEFADGKIRYERLTLKNILSAFPADIQVDLTSPMNIFSGSALDALAVSMPGAIYLARMAVITGHKRNGFTPGSVI